MTKELSVDEQALKRKTRRRLLGAAALTLFAVVVLPMVLDNAPRPSESGISLDIPAADKVSEFAPQPVQPAPEPVVETPPVVAPVAPVETPVEVAPPKTVPPKPVLVIPPVNTPNAKRYLIHVGNYSNPTKAAQVIGKLKQNNLKVTTEQSGNLTRIRVGPFADREQADKARQLLQKQGTRTSLLILTK